MSFEVDRTEPEKPATPASPVLPFPGALQASLTESLPNVSATPSSRLQGALLRAVPLLLATLLLGKCYLHFSDRPEFLSLAAESHGPSPKKANQLVFLLHGYGGSADDMDWVVDDLRKRGLSEHTALIAVEGPIGVGMGRAWADSPLDLRESERRVMAFIEKNVGSIPRERVWVAGFSQGAQLSLRIAGMSPRVGGAILLSGCRYQFPAPPNPSPPTRLLFLHGRSDSICGFGPAETIARQLKEREHDVEFISFEGDHVIDNTCFVEMMRVLQP